MNRQILASLLVIGLVGAIASGTTLAEFTDTESSNQNVFTAGALDLKIDWNESYNGVNIQNVSLTDLDGEPIFDIGDVKPGDYGEATISFHLYDNPGWLWMRLNLTSNDDVSSTEPELETTDNPEDNENMFDGELAERILVDLWYDTSDTNGAFPGDNIRQPDERDIFDGQTCEFVPIDLAIAMDRSGSMTNEPGKFDGAKDGAQILVNSLADNDQGALVSFSSSATLDEELTTDKTALNDSIDALNAGGSTNIADAIDEAHDELLNGANARGDAAKVLVLLTNGNPNTGGDAVAAAEAAKNDGIRIITIAYGGDANAAILAQIASEGDAYTAGIDDVEDVFASISDEICTPTTLADLDAVAQNGILLDADPETEEPDEFVNSTTRYIGFAWELPYEVGNEVQTDETTFDLDFYAVQHRHNANPTSPWAVPE